MALLLKHKGLIDNPSVDVGKDPLIVIIDEIDIRSLPSPLSMKQQLASVETRQRLLVSMSVDSIYDNKTRENIATRSKIPIKNDYIPPLNRLLGNRGLDPLMPYRVFYRPNRRDYMFFQKTEIPVNP